MHNNKLRLASSNSSINRSSTSTPNGTSSTYSPLSPGTSSLLGSQSIHFSPTGSNFKNLHHHRSNLLLNNNSGIIDENNNTNNNNNNDNNDIEMKDVEKEHERKIIPGLKHEFGSNRISEVTYTNPGVKYPRYSQFGESQKQSLLLHRSSHSNLNSHHNHHNHHHNNNNNNNQHSKNKHRRSKEEERPYSSDGSNHSIKLPSIELMQSFPDRNSIKDRHQSILSSTTSNSSSNFSHSNFNHNKRTSVLTSSSLSTSIDGLSSKDHGHGITSIPENFSDTFSDYGLIQPSRFDRPLPLPPMYQNKSSTLSDMASETSANNSYYSHQNNHYFTSPAPFFNDGGSTTSSFLSNRSPQTGGSLSSSGYNHQSTTTPFQSPLPPLPSPQQQLQHQSSHANIASIISKNSHESKNSKHTTTINQPNSSSSSPPPPAPIMLGSSLPANSEENQAGISNYTSTLKFSSAPEEERKYQCKTCGRKFKTSGHVSRHSRIHTGERKHVCPYPGCGARFARHDNCMQHYKTHSNLNGKTAERMRNLKLKEQLSTKKMKIKALIW